MILFSVTETLAVELKVQPSWIPINFSLITNIFPLTKVKTLFPKTITEESPSSILISVKFGSIAVNVFVSLSYVVVFGPNQTPTLLLGICKAAVSPPGPNVPLAQKLWQTTMLVTPPFESTIPYEPPTPPTVPPFYPPTVGPKFAGGLRLVITSGPRGPITTSKFAFADWVIKTENNNTVKA